MARRKGGEWNNEEYRQRKLFETQLTRIDSVNEAERFVRQGPSGSEPGAQFYSNLGNLISQLNVPMHSQDWERKLYVGLLNRFVTNGEWESIASRLIEELGAKPSRPNR